MKDKIKTIIIFIAGILCIALMVIALFFSLFDSVKTVIESPEILLTISLLVLGILIYYLVKKYKEYSRHNKIYMLVSWCVKHNSHNSICYKVLSLRDYIHNTQNDLNIHIQYRISIEDLELVEMILYKFEASILNEYFCDNTTFCIPKSKYSLNGENYFFYSLHSYLYEHQCDYMFCENKMHQNIISRKEYEGDGSNTTYELTDFAVVFQKLLYISYMYCKNSPVINQIEPYYSQERIQKSIEETISSKSISISRYRP